MSDCPNCGASMPFSHPMTVDVEQGAQKMESTWLVYDGVMDVDASVQSDHIELEMEIDQSEYVTENFFKHREVWEAREEFEVEDIADGVVIVRTPLRVARDITAFKCQDCGTVYDEELGVLS